LIVSLPPDNQVAIRFLQSLKLQESFTSTTTAPQPESFDTAREGSVVGETGEKRKPGEAQVYQEHFYDAEGRRFDPNVSAYFL